MLRDSDEADGGRWKPGHDYHHAVDEKVILILAERVRCFLELAHSHEHDTDHWQWFHCAQDAFAELHRQLRKGLGEHLTEDDAS